MLMYVYVCQTPDQTSLALLIRRDQRIALLPKKMKTTREFRLFLGLLDSHERKTKKKEREKRVDNEKTTPARCTYQGQ
jgi:hypothetical protein